MSKTPNGNFILCCGEHTYEVTPEAKKAIESAIYWTHCERLDRQELQSAKLPDSSYSAEAIADLENTVEQERLTLSDAMKAMEKAGVPNWVGNGAMEWARNNNLKEHHIEDFFEKSDYSKLPEQRKSNYER